MSRAVDAFLRENGACWSEQNAYRGLTLAQAWNKLRRSQRGQLLFVASRVGVPVDRCPCGRPDCPTMWKNTPPDRRREIVSAVWWRLPARWRRQIIAGGGRGYPRTRPK